MCPVCAATIAIVAFGAVSSGALGLVTVKAVRVKLGVQTPTQSHEAETKYEGRNHDVSQPD